MLLLSTLAVIACFRSELPVVMAWMLAVAAFVYGTTTAWRLWRQPVLDIVIRADGTVRVDDLPVEGFRVSCRGPLVVACWRDSAGHVVRRPWLPDTLAASTRRELRLALIRTAPARIAETVAP